MVNWNEVEKDAEGDFFKPAEGKTVLEIVGEPVRKPDKYGKMKYEAKVFVNDNNDKALSWGISPQLMTAIGDLLKKPVKLHGKRFILKREGLNKDNTKYFVLPEADKVVQQ